MKFDYLASGRNAKSLLDKFGQLNTVSVLTGKGVYNPETGSATKTYTDVYVLSVFLNYAAGELPENLVGTKSIKMITADFTPEPIIDSKVLRDGIEYRVADVKRVKPASVNVIYILRLEA